MKKSILYIVTLLLICGSMFQVCAAKGLTQLQKNSIDTLLEQQIFHKYDRKKIDTIHTRLKNINKDMYKNSKHYGVISYIIESFLKQYDRIGKVNQVSKQSKKTSLVGDMLEKINEVRKSKKLPPLTISDTLSTLAKVHTKNMLEKNFYDHTSPDGTTFSDRIAQSGYASAAGENIARGSDNIEKIMEAWLKSEGHRNNILNNNFSEVGIFYSEGYWTTIYGEGK